MSAMREATTLEQLSDCLLRLGQLARDVPAARFIGQAVELVRELISFPRGWWGLGADAGEGSIPAIHQSEYIGLPDGFAAAWQEIALIDGYGADIRRHPGQVQRYAESGEHALPPEIIAFDRRYDVHHSMGLALDDAATGHGFFIVLYRGKDDPPFTDQDALLFQHLMRHILQLWHYRLQDALAHQDGQPLERPGAEADTPRLSPREHLVAQLFAAGHSYKEIARLQGLAPATVRTYLRDAYLRLGVNNKVRLGQVLSGKRTT